MKRRTRSQRRLRVASAAAACYCLALVPVPVLAAHLSPASVQNRQDSETAREAGKVSEKCLSDVRSFVTQLEGANLRQGGKRSASDFPADESACNNDAAPYGPQRSLTACEVGALVASAKILARHGNRQTCEETLDAARAIYQAHAAEILHPAHPTVNELSWRKRQILAAEPVTGKNMALQPDQLLGIDVRNAQDENLGFVDNVIIDPQIGKIAYLVIAWGGTQGIDEKHVAVPWRNFKVIPDATLLVLDASESAMDAAPLIDSDQLASLDHLARERQRVDRYWKQRTTERQQPK